MKLILGGINGEYLRYVTDNFASETEEVLAAVAYAHNADLLFNWCYSNEIPLKFWGRLDDGIAVSVPILKGFLDRKSSTHTCKLVQHHHAKVIWWRGVGLYIGSANLSDSAWNKNIEAGCFFDEAEIDQQMASDIEQMFEVLDEQATPLTEELFNEMKERQKAIERDKKAIDKFWQSPSFSTWSGLITTAPKKASEHAKSKFLEEWHETLQLLRDLGQRVSEDANRPTWIPENTPSGAQIDQFLHAHYYQRTFDGRKANYQAFFEENRAKPEAAFAEAVGWWKKLPKAPENEDEMLKIRAPFLQKLLSSERLSSLSESEFAEICNGVHSVVEYARRVSNKAVSLRTDGTKYTIPQKVEALANQIWQSQSGNGSRVNEVIKHVLYGGTQEQLPERLWQAVTDPMWKIDLMGISAFGEIVGWALPDKFPPRNGRTSKALRSLGYNVKIHV